MQDQVSHKFSAEDVTSITAVQGVLDAQIAQLGPASRIAHLWRDWTDLLGPTATGTADRALEIALDQVTPPAA